MQYVLSGLLLLALLGSGSGHAEIYRCIDAEGHHTFTDRPCPGQQRYSPSETPAVAFTPIAATDRKRLQAAQQRDRRERQAQRHARAARYRQQLAQLAERQALCEAASNGLQQLKAQRRKGYSLQAQRQLDAKEAAFKLSKRQHC